MKVDRAQAIPSPLRYPGGKSRVALRLLPFMPEGHAEYREPFIGGAGIFLRKPKAQRNWINDLHPGLYAFWRALRDHFEAFAELCRAQPTDDLRATFQHWIDRRDLMEARGDEALVERAVQFYFINRTVWYGRVVYDPGRESRLYFSNPDGWGKLDKKLKHLQRCSRKLQGVTITCSPFEECVTNASADDFIYADPPYYRDSLDHPCSRLYGGHFAVKQHTVLRDLLAASPAKVMVSYDDRDEVRELYSDEGKWRIYDLEWKYCGRRAMTNHQIEAKVKEKKVTGSELLILNYQRPGGA